MADLEEKRSLLLTGTLTTSLLLVAQQLGLLQPLELAAYDQMLRLRPDRGPDPRLLVVEISQADMEALPDAVISDATFAQLLTQLQRHQPAGIGVDAFLEPPYPPGTEQLKAQLLRPNVISITSLGNQESERKPPPQGIPAAQIGFSDLPIDPDGVIRTSTLLPFDPQFQYPSLSLRLVQQYLAAGCPGYTPQKVSLPCQDITFRAARNGQYQLGSVPLRRLQATDGGYQTLDDRGYQFLLDYRAAHNAIPSITLTQALNGADPKLIRNKIVLIGYSAPIVKDLFLTPFSATAAGNRQTPGVFLHAQMASQLLSTTLDGRSLFWFWPDWVEILWLMGWASTGVTLTWLTRKPLILLGGGVALLALLFASSFGLFLLRGWIPIAAPAFGFVFSTGAAIAYKQYQTQQQQQIVMRLLGQQTSPEIANALWEGRHHLTQAGRLSGQMLTATILFSDIKGFSSISEERSPADVMAWLNQYLALMSDEVQHHQGVINKFVGDGIMAVFGVPIARTEFAAIAADAQNAVWCALAMRQRLEELNQAWQQQGLPLVQMRVGIFTGSVMVGSLGGTSRLEYGVIGDSVNTASRLESCEKARQIDDCRILIAQETLDYLQNQFAVEAWGHLPLKGKQRPVAVYRVLSPIGSPALLKTKQS